MFYLFNNAVYWSYGLKQWAIAEAVPKIEDKGQISALQERYKCIKLGGWVANVSFALLLGVFRYMIVIEIPNQKDWVLDANIISVFLIEVILLCSAILLGKAMSRYKQTFKDNQNFQENKKIMYIILFVAIGHIGCEVAITWLVEVELRKNGRQGEFYEFPILQIILASILGVG